MFVLCRGESLQFFRDAFQLLSRAFRRAIAGCFLSRGFRQTASGGLAHAGVFQGDDDLTVADGLQKASTSWALGDPISTSGS
jgi:hypothetical protein